MCGPLKLGKGPTSEESPNMQIWKKNLGTLIGSRKERGGKTASDEETRRVSVYGRKVKCLGDITCQVKS